MLVAWYAISICDVSSDCLHFHLLATMIYFIIRCNKAIFLFALLFTRSIIYCQNELQSISRLSHMLLMASVESDIQSLSFSS